MSYKITDYSIYPQADQTYPVYHTHPYTVPGTQLRGEVQLIYERNVKDRTTTTIILPSTHKQYTPVMSYNK